MNTFVSVIDRFDSAEALASAIKEKGVTVRAWRMRNSIPARCWPAVAEAAAKKGLDGITVDVLCQIAISTSQERRAS